MALLVPAVYQRFIENDYITFTLDAQTHFHYTARAA